MIAFRFYVIYVREFVPLWADVAQRHSCRKIGELPPHVQKPGEDRFLETRVLVRLVHLPPIEMEARPLQLNDVVLVFGKKQHPAKWREREYLELRSALHDINHWRLVLGQRVVRCELAPELTKVASLPAPQFLELNTSSNLDYRGLLITRKRWNRAFLFR